MDKKSVDKKKNENRSELVGKVDCFGVVRKKKRKNFGVNLPMPCIVHSTWRY